MANAIILNTDKIQATLSFTMTLSEWKQIRKTLCTNRAYIEIQVINEISDLVEQLEKTLYSNVKTPVN